MKRQKMNAPAKRINRIPGSGMSTGGSSGGGGITGGGMTGGTWIGGGPKIGGGAGVCVLGGSAGGASLVVVGGTRPASITGAGLYPASRVGTGRGVKKNGWRPSAGLLPLRRSTRN